MILPRPPRRSPLFSIEPPITTHNHPKPFATTRDHMFPPVITQPLVTMPNNPLSWSILSFCLIIFLCFHLSVFSSFCLFAFLYFRFLVSCLFVSSSICRFVVLSFCLSVLLHFISSLFILVHLTSLAFIWKPSESFLFLFVCLSFFIGPRSDHSLP